MIDNIPKSPQNPMAAPIPIRGSQLKVPKDAVPNITNRRPLYGTIEIDRESHYNLAYPISEDEIAKMHLDKNLRFYARNRPRLLNLPRLLPYAIESPKDRAKFLSHIVAHLYIAIKSLDIQGLLAITAKDLASLSSAAGLSDLDLALETNLFEASSNHDEDVVMDGDDELLFQDSDDVDSEETLQHKRLPKLAAVVNVRVWTHELLIWLKMKYEMPLSLRKSLAKVYYAICTCRGQHLNLKVYVKTFEILTKNIELMQQKEPGDELRLPWKPVYHDLETHFRSVDSLFDPLEKKDLSLVLRVAERASRFFSEIDLPEIFKALGSRLSIPDASLVLSSMSLLPPVFGTVIDQYDLRYYLESYFYTWKKLSKSTGVDSHLTSRIGLCTMMFLDQMAKVPLPGFGKFGILTKEQFAFLMNTLLNSLSINVEKFASMKTTFMHGFLSAVVFSMNGDTSLERDGILDQVEALLNCIKSFVHPSNSGEWSKPILKLTMSMIYQFHKRFVLEKEGHLASLPTSSKLSKKVSRRFVGLFLPFVKTGIHLKVESVSEDYFLCLGLLAHVDLRIVLDGVLLDVYESLEGVILSHRVVSALRTIEELMRYLVLTPGFRVHLLRIMTMALPGIDSNDLSKTFHTLTLFATMANFVPIADLGGADENVASEFILAHLESLIEADSEQKFIFDANFEINALRSSSTAFKNLMRLFVERVILLLEILPDSAKSSGTEKEIASYLPKFVHIMIEAMSDDIFMSFRAQFIDFVMENTIYTVSDIVGGICGGIIRRDPSYFPELSSTLIDKIRDDILQNGAGKARTGIDIVPRDRMLFWNLIILNHIVGNAESQVMLMGDKLLEFSFFLMENVKGPCLTSSAHLLNQMLQAVTKIRLRESRLINKAYEKKNGITEECWGGFQFSEYRFSEENLSLEWFVPEREHIEFAVSVFQLHVTRVLNNISRVLQNVLGTVSLEPSDELRVNFFYLAYALSGLSFLFDPSFDEAIPQLHKSESLQQRLILLKQLRELKYAKTLDEDSVDNIQENLQRIVSDMEDVILVDEKSYDARETDYSDLDPRRAVSPHSSVPKSDANVNPHSRFLSFLFARTESGHESGQDSVMSQVNSPTESARSTPKLGDADLSSVNPASTFRERKLYTSKYFFGEDMACRRSDKLYLQVHKTRHLIGESLHIICKFMMSELLDDTKLFLLLLFVFNTWFADVGRERLLALSHAKISYGFVSDIQKINRFRKAFTRVALASRVELYHQLRVTLHATSRTMTNLDKLLIEDLIRLSCSTYTAVAEWAQNTVEDIMKRVNGSYGAIIKFSLKNLQNAIDTSDHKRVESGLALFELKKVNNKVRSDAIHFESYILLLQKCLAIDNHKVKEIAERLMKDFALTSPNRVCLIDESLVDTIRPPDELIDLEIKAVALAKDKKRSLFAQAVENAEHRILEFDKRAAHWKISSLNLTFLVESQSNFERPLNKDVLEHLIHACSSDHPVLSKIALKGFIKVFNKLHFMKTHENNLANAYDPNYINQDLKEVQTTPDYTPKWKAELLSSAPSYYADHNYNCGWMFWNDKMLVLKNKPQELYDPNVVAALAKPITKSWVHGIVMTWISGNEAISAYQGTDVFFTNVLVALIASKAVSFEFSELLEIIEEVYVEDEKSSHIVVCELVAGILVASRFLTEDMEKQRDAFLVPFLTRVFHDLSPETKSVWSVFSWWIPSHVDIRRFPKISRILLNVDVSGSSFYDATRLTQLKSFVFSLTWRFPDPDLIVQACFDNLHHRYSAIREQFGALLAVLGFAYYNDSFSSYEDFLQHTNDEPGLRGPIFAQIPALFDSMQSWYIELEQLSPQEILDSKFIYTATAVLEWLTQALNSSIAVQYQYFVVPYFVPFLLRLISMKEVCQLGGIEPITAFKRVSQVPYNSQTLEDIVTMLEGLDKLNVLQSVIVAEFTETFFFKNLFLLTWAQRSRVIAFVNSAMCSKSVETREAFSGTFSGLVHTLPPFQQDEIIITYKAKYLEGLKDRIDAARLHAAVLGLGALVHAFSFQSPPPKWMPAILTSLSRVSNISGVVGRAAKDILSRFKKTRQDTWHIDYKVFSEEEMQNLEGVLWKSYFA